MDGERRRAIDDAINLYGELMQRLSKLPDRSAKMAAAALFVAVRTPKQGVDLASGGLAADKRAGTGISQRRSATGG